MKNSILTVNVNSGAVALNTPIPLGNVQARTGCARLTGSSLLLPRGKYMVDVSATFTAAATGDVVFQVYQNGNPIPGATASVTVSLADTQVKFISIPALVETYCRCNAAITVQASGNIPTLSNFTVRAVEYQ